MIQEQKQETVKFTLQGIEFVPTIESVGSIAALMILAAGLYYIVKRRK